MPVYMTLCGAANGQPTPFDGQYLKAFDFEAGDGSGEIETTPNLAEAMAFDDMPAAIAFWNRSPVCRPIRPDGKPNKPLTATNWSFASMEKPA